MRMVGRNVLIYSNIHILPPTLLSYDDWLAIWKFILALICLFCFAFMFICEVFGKCDTWTDFFVLMGIVKLNGKLIHAWVKPPWLANRVLFQQAYYCSVKDTYWLYSKPYWSCARELASLFTEFLKTVDIYYKYTHFTTQDRQLLNSLAYIITCIHLFYVACLFCITCSIFQR